VLPPPGFACALTVTTTEALVLRLATSVTVTRIVNAPVAEGVQVKVDALTEAHPGGNPEYAYDKVPVPVADTVRVTLDPRVIEDAEAEKELIDGAFPAAEKATSCVTL